MLWCVGLRWILYCGVSCPSVLSLVVLCWLALDCFCVVSCPIVLSFGCVVLRLVRVVSG